jgi:two-component system sensor histidine kinase KdpD
MLLAGQQRQEEGIDTVIGVIETHGRVETQALTAGLARVSLREVEHRGVILREMDLDAILERRPRLVLVDELAHSNAPGSRHPKRYQDVSELLDAGIDVYTTLNIQHVESQRDVVTQITGAPVFETVPDSLLDDADELELIDVSAEQLRKRLAEGKVYLGDRAAAAADHFFREGNLKALRELALRLTAERADREVREFLRIQHTAGPWRSRERLLVAVGPSPHSARLIRWTRRMAAATHGSWIAVSVDTGARQNEAAARQLEHNLLLARSLGAEVVLTSGADVSETVLRVAREQHVSQIVVGKPPKFGFLSGVAARSPVGQILRQSGDIDVCVVRAEKTEAPWKPDFSSLSQPRFWKESAVVLLVLLTTTVFGLLLKPLVGYTAIGLIYLLAVLISSMVLTRGPILILAALTALAWNFLFIVPYFTFQIGSIQDAILFGLYFVVAFVMGHLNTRLRRREAAERTREMRSAVLYAFSRDVMSAQTLADALTAATGHMKRIFDADASIFVAANGALASSPIAGAPISDREFAVANYAFAHREPAGRFTATLPDSAGYHIPLRGNDGVVGVAAVFFPAQARPGLPEREILETFAAQLGLLVEREEWKRRREALKLEERSRDLQKTLLDSVSHELKTPLAVMATAVETLHRRLTDPLLGELQIAIGRLNRIVNHLLDINRIETGTLNPRLEWCDLREIIEDAIARAEPTTHPVSMTLASDVAAVRIDGTLLEEILTNLIRNAVQHSPMTSEISVCARADADRSLRIEVADAGAGIPDPSRIFEKFVRGSNAAAGGLGMGLSIVRGFAEALGGSVTHTPRPDGKSGSVFIVSLPVETQSEDALCQQ